MKNLKRVLSLGLASVMLMGMMVMGASAASFSDADEIDNTEAVNLMVALNVITGKDDGSFDPDGSVTRAEMATMITRILFGGEEATLSTGATPKFADTANHWARRYIEYCASDSQKIIAGMGDGNFAPDAQVTGTQAAKMALVALGYNAEVYGFENTPDWEININYRANTREANLYNGLRGMNPSAPITRDQAAQILYNALNARTVKPQFTITSSGIQTEYIVSEQNPTLLEDKFDVEIHTGILNGVEYNEEDEVYVYSFGSVTKPEGSTITTGDEFAEDVSDLFKRKVDIVVNADGDILGIGASKDSAVLSSGVLGSIDVESTVSDITKIDGFNVTDADFYTFLGTELTVTSGDDEISGSGLEDFYTYAVINNEGGKTADVVVIYPVSVEKVSFVGSSTITTTLVAGESNGGSYTIEDCDVYSGIKRNDYVIVTKGIEGETSDDPDAFTIEKAEIVSGSVSASRRNGAEIRVNGDWYKLSGLTFDTDVKLNNEYDIVTLNGYAFQADIISETASGDVAYVVARNEITGNDTIERGAQTVRLMFADGTTKTVTVDRIYDKNDDEFKTVDRTYQAQLDTLYTYTVTAAGNYRLTAVADRNEYEVETNLTSVKDGRANTTLRFANDAVIFVKDGDGDVTVLTGAEVAAWRETTTSTTSAITSASSPVYADKASNGFNTISLGVITLTGKIPGRTGRSTDNYGILTAAPIVVSEDGTRYYEATIWTAEGELEVKVETSDVTGGTLGNKSIVKFDDLGNGYAENMQILTLTNGAVTGYDGDEDIVIATAEHTDGVSAKITEDTAIIFFNTRTNKGVEGGEIILATETGANKLAYNVKFLTETNDDSEEEVEEVTVILVDTNNQLYTNSTDKVADLELPTQGGSQEHTHSYAWSVLDAEEDGHQAGEHKGTCTNQTGTCNAQTIYHAADAAEADRGGCTLQHS